MQRSWLALVVLSLGISACGSKSGGDDAATQSISWPAKDMASDKDSQWGGMNIGDKQQLSSENGVKNIVWLNFDGGTVLAADSFIVKKANLPQFISPAFAPADLGASYAAQDRAALIATVLAEVKKEFAGVNVTISTEKPSGGHATVYIGGNNFTGVADVLGVSPLDVGNFSGTDNIFVFPKEVGIKDSADNIIILAHTIAHEIAHSLGARHITNDMAIMSPIVLVKSDKFDQEGPTPDNGPAENSLKILQMNVGQTDYAGIDTTLPKLVNLNIEAEGDVAQLSVFNLDNLNANPTLNLSSYAYTFDFLGAKVDGHTVRFVIRDSDPHPITVTVTNTKGETASFNFSMAKPLPAFFTPTRRDEPTTIVV
jgi:hypothetical protein